MTEDTQPQVDPAAVAALIAANTSSAPQPPEEPETKPGPRQVALDPGLGPVVEELKSADPARPKFEPEPNLAFMPEYPATLRDGAFKKYGDALEKAVISREQREEYLRALLSTSDSYQDACHRWDIPLLEGQLVVRIRSINGYEETLMDEVVRGQLKRGDALLPATLRNTEICCSIVLQVCQYNGGLPWRHLTFDPANASNNEQNMADRLALEEAANQLMLTTTPAQRKACVAALQMFEAMTLKCQVGVFDESF